MNIATGINCSVLIAEENPLLREGLRHLINERDELDCVGAIDDITKTYEIAVKLSPDVIIVDLTIGSLEQARIIKIISKQLPQTPVGVLIDKESFQNAFTLIEAGAKAVIPKDTPHEDLCDIIVMISKGYTVISAETSKTLIETIDHNIHRSGRSAIELLHYRELQVLKLAGKGMSNKQIANELGISTNTVGTHFINIYRKLGVQSRTEAVLLGLRKKLFTLEDLE